MKRNYGFLDDADANSLRNEVRRLRMQLDQSRRSVLKVNSIAEISHKLGVQSSDSIEVEGLTVGALAGSFGGGLADLDGDTYKFDGLGNAIEHSATGAAGEVRIMRYGMFIPEGGSAPAGLLLFSGEQSADLVTNGSFETGSFTSGWATVTGTVVSTAEAKDGLFVAQSGTTDDIYTTFLTSSRISVSAATSYEIMFYKRKTNPLTIASVSLKVSVKWYSALSGGTLLGTDVIFADVIRETEFSRVAAVYTAPAGALGAALVFETIAGVATTEAIWVDHVQMFSLALARRVYFAPDLTYDGGDLNLTGGTVNLPAGEMPNAGGQEIGAYAGDEATLHHRLLAGRHDGYTWDDFDGSAIGAGWAWASDSPFVTPTVDMATYPSVIGISSSTNGARGFLKRAAAPTTGLGLLMLCAFYTGVDSFIGCRVDDGSDTNYVECGLYSDGATWKQQIHYRAGGAVTTVTATSGISAGIPQQVLLNITGTRWSSWGLNGWLSVPTLFAGLSQLKYVDGTTGLTWTPTRIGLTFRNITGTNGVSVDRFGY